MIITNTQRKYYVLYDIKLTFKLILVALVFLSTLTILSSPCYANNLAIENVSISGQDSTEETAVVNLDISWDNSWRNSVNYDAVWVFVKFSKDAGSTWEHATLLSAGTNSSGMSTGSGDRIDVVVPSDRKGCMVQRSFVGAGGMEVSGVELTWSWGEDGVAVDDSVRIKVFGVEMAYVPEGAFYAGDGDGFSESQYAFHPEGSDNTKAYVSSAAVSITCDNNGSDDIDSSSVTVSGSSGITGNANYPTGYSAFYLMKYEITEDQWVGFFNTLSTAEKANRDVTGSSGKNSDGTVNRNTVSWTTGDAATARPDRVCGYISWPDLCAYADWAALRPATELEFEKTSRGEDVLPNDGEYAWGTTTVTAATTISGAETGAATVTNADANACYDNQTFSGGDGGTGPLRAGIFAGSSTTRQQAGAGYYGVMELSGNIWERFVSVGTSSGRAFTGSHGDGALETAAGYEGNATNTDWPGFVTAQGVTGGSGSGFRGGSWVETSSGKLAVSDRSEASIASAARLSDSGGRCARTAP